MNRVCIKQNWPNKSYDLAFFRECNDDEVIRDDLEDKFFNDPDYLDYYDIKVFSQTPLKDYEKILVALEKNLSTRSKTIHFSNAPYWNKEWKKGYEEFSVCSSLYDKILKVIMSSPKTHTIEIHVKKASFQRWNDEAHNKALNDIINRLEHATNITHVCISESNEIHYKNSPKVETKEKDIYSRRYIPVPIP
tara:strand:+ start:943 stop:1518 length:576 start_codon:yes stop_codon:yes gene_type:complete